MTGPNECPAPVAAGREANFDGAGKRIDANTFSTEVNPVGVNSRDGVMSLFTSALHPYPSGTITAEALWDRFRSPADAEAMGRIRPLTWNMLLLPHGLSEWKEKKDLKDKLKRELSAVTMSCCITSGGARTCS